MTRHVKARSIVTTTRNGRSQSRETREQYTTYTDTGAQSRAHPGNQRSEVFVDSLTRGAGWQVGMATAAAGIALGVVGGQKALAWFRSRK